MSGGDIEERGEVGGHDPKKQISKFTKISKFKKISKFTKINLPICYRILKIVAPILKHRKNCECCPGHYLSTSVY